MKPARGAGVLVVLALLVACSPAKEPADQARDAAREALERGDRAGALAAIRELRRQGSPSPESVLELSRLLTRAGEAPEAQWLMASALARHPERDDLRVELARVALLVGNPSLARSAVAPVTSRSPHYAEARFALARAELGLGHLERGLELLREAEATDPDRPEARLPRIVMLLRERRLGEARAALEEAERSLTGPDAEGLRARLRATLAQVQAAQGDPDAAIEALGELVRERPRSVGIWHLLARLLWSEGRSGELIEALRSALALEPSPLELHPLLARTYARLGRTDDAEAELRTYAQRAGSPAAFVELADYYAQRGDAERVEAVFAEAIELLPDESMLRRFHTESLLTLGRLEAARAELAHFRSAEPGAPEVEYLQARLDLEHGHPEAAAARLVQVVSRLDRATTQFWLGRALEAAGDPEGARRRYGLAIQRDPDWKPPHQALVRLARRRSDWRSLASLGQRLIRHSPGTIDGWAASVDALVRLGEGERAEPLARRAVRIFPDRLEPILLLASALRSQGRSGDALAELDRGLERLGPSPELAAERALTLGMAGRVEEGIAAARAALEGDPESARLLWALAALLFGAGEEAAGSQVVDRALALDPDDPAPLRLRCEFRTARGLHPGALRDCTRYLERRPDDAQVHFMLGLVLAGQGETDGAIASYRRAIELDPRAHGARNNLAELLAERGDLAGALEQAQEAYRIARDDPQVIDTLAGFYQRRGLAERADALRRRTPRTSADRREMPSQPAAAPDGGPALASPSGVVRPRATAGPLAGLDRHNVVLIVVDTLRADRTTPYGFAQDTTPELARWAARGVVFERVRSQSSWTKIAMASLMTSLWPRSHGIREAKDGLADAAVTLAEVLKQAGYATWGVQTNGWLHQSFGFHQGFDRYMFPRGGSPRLFSRPSVWPHADRVVEEAARLLEEARGGQPFFLYLHFMDVHEYAAPPEFRRFGTGSEGAYLDAVRWVDHAVERVRRLLEAEGLLGRTLLVFTSDHGETFGEHDVHGHARNVLTPVVSVPLVLRPPLPLTPPVRIAHQVRSLDVAPTLLDALGIPVPASFEGESLLPLLRGDTREADRISYAGLGTPLFRDASVQVSVTDGAWTYARNLEPDADPPELLFDRSVDPGENVDLAQLEPQRAARWRERLDRHLAVEPAPVSTRDVHIDPAIAERLRAIGYLEEPPERPARGTH